MNKVFHILIAVVLAAGLAAALGGMRDYCTGSCPTPEEPMPDVNKEVSHNHDAFNDYHDTFTIEDLANNDDAFDDYHDTFTIEDLANNDDAFDDYHDTFTIEDLANNDDAFSGYHDTFTIEDLV